MKRDEFDIQIKQSFVMLFRQLKIENKCVTILTGDKYEKFRQSSYFVFFLGNYHAQSSL